MPTKTPSSHSDPSWVKGTFSGYDPATKQWRSSDGRKITRTEALHRSDAELRSIGQLVQGGLGRDQMSRAAENLERFIGGFDPYNPQQIGPKANTEPAPYVLPIPGPVLSAYRLADFYYRTEGDISSLIETPIQLSMRSIDIYSDSKEVKDILGSMYDVDGIDLPTLCRDLWLSTAVYGIGHPWEIWEGSNLHAIIVLPPPYTWVGNHMQPNGGLQLSEEDAKRTLEGLQTLLPAHYYRSFLNTLETKPLGQFPIEDNALFSVRGIDHPWLLYPKPWMQGAFRSLSTRMVYEEMRRSIFEGFRYQLWTFLLGDVNNKPSPEMMQKLIADVNGMSGERTGSLAWWGGLRIEVHTPKTDRILEPEEFQSLNMEIFRRMGFNMRMATGNPNIGDRGSGFDVDVDLGLEKMDYMRQGLLRWERAFRLRFAKRTGDKALLEAMRKASVVFSVSPLELRKQIKDMLIPLFTTGALSHQTLLSRAGFNFDTEIANKKSNKDNGFDDLLSPPPTFAQKTVNPNTPEQTVASPDTGRPTEKGIPETRQDLTPKGTDVKASEEPRDRVEDFKSGMAAAIEMMREQLVARPDSGASELADAIRSAQTGEDQFGKWVQAFMERAAVPPQITIHNQAPAAPDVTVNVPPTQVQAAEAPVIQFSPQVIVPQGPAPVVNNQVNVPTPLVEVTNQVASPAVTVNNQPAAVQVDVNVPAAPTDFEEVTEVVERDSEGLMAKAVKKTRAVK